MQFLGLFYALIIHRHIIPEQNTAADTCISRPAAVLLSIKIHTALERRAGK